MRNLTMYYKNKNKKLAASNLVIDQRSKIIANLIYYLL